MAGTLPIPRNGVVDAADVISKLAPLFLGSGQQTTTGSSYLPELDPTVVAQSDALLASLTQRMNTTAHADKVIEDILYRAQLAFAPVLGDEKKAGLYNTTVRKQLANETVARASAAGAQAILEDQQRAMAAATQVQGNRMQAASNAQVAGKSTTSTSRTSPQIPLKSAATGILAGIAGNWALKKGATKIEDLITQLTAPGKGIESGPWEDASGNFSGSAEDYFAASGAWQAPGMSGANSSPMGFGGDDAMTGSFMSAESASAPSSGIMFADDTTAMQSLIDSVTVPTVSPEMVQVAQAGASDSPQGLEGDTSASTLLEVAPPITASDVVTPLPMPPAVQSNPLTGMPLQVMPPAQPMMPPAVPDSTIDMGPEVISTGDGFEDLASDVFTADSVSTAGDVAISSGLDAGVGAGSAFVGDLAVDPALAGADAAGAGLDLSFLSGMPIPYFTIANAATDGALGEAIMDIPVVGDVLGAAGEAISDIPIVGDLVSGFSEGVGDVVSGAGDVLEGAGDVVGDIWDGASGVFEGVGEAAGSIICTEAVRQKLLDPLLVSRETRINLQERKLSRATCRGYQFLAAPLVRRMRKDSAFAIKAAAYARAYCEHITGDRSSFLGALLRYVGEPICFMVGKFVVPSNFDYVKAIA